MEKKIAIIRIKGQLDLHPDVKKTFALLKLARKFSCVVIEDKPETVGMLRKIQNHVIYGYINEETLRELMSKRGKADKKETEQVFSLHPPRGGFKKSSKLMWPKGILGKNEKINEFILRML